MKHMKLLLAALSVSLILTGCAPAAESNPPAASSSASASSAETKQTGEAQSNVSDVSTEPSESTAPAQSGEPAESGSSSEPVEAEPIGWSWFDDAVMIGDSVSLKLKNFVVKQRQTEPDYFGKAQFLTSGSLGSGNALWEVSDKSVHPSFQGEKMRLEDSVPLTGAKKIYLMLGTNDIAVYGIEDSVANMETLIDLIAANVPGAQFFVQTATPICEGAEKKGLNNAALVEYNQALEEMCERRGFRFVDVAGVLRDENGFLPREYCSDPDGMGIHLTDVACDLWLNCLLDDAADLTANG